ncbi:NAD(P)-binding protein [Hymenopellis radicata]|nr:NAD(P)-binding protein [Hymenopellis radicata]
MSQKIVVCGAGFIGTQITRLLTKTPCIRVQLSSRTPQKSYDQLKSTLSPSSLLPPVSVDVKSPSSLSSAFKNASMVISLVGIMHGTPKDFEDIQWKGAAAVAGAAHDVGAQLIHFSAIGADSSSPIPYARTKGLGEKAVFENHPNATIIRPSLVFGPNDDFFNRFSRLSKFLPFLPVFGGGSSLFQPVFVDDLARLVDLIAKDASVAKEVQGKIIEAGGPEVFTYKQLMEAVLKYNGRTRPIVSLPFAFGILQGAVLEQLPVNLFTVTRAQVEQLKSDNIVNPNPEANCISLENLFRKHSSTPDLRSIHDVLPSYL